MTVFLADDQPGVRSALRLLLEQQEGVIVAGEAATAAELMARLPSLRCDLLLVDWELPGLPRCELVAHAAAARPPLRILALTTGSALQPGVPCVSKSEPPQHLLRALGAAPAATASAPFPA